MADFACRSFEDVKDYHQSADVIVCGFGGAGGSAALEARKAGADVIIFERASGGGGSTAMSSCEMYLGGSGGTSLQKDLGYEDSTENMLAYLQEALGAKGDPEKMRLYAEGGAAHFDWVESLGVPYKRAVMLDREVVPLTDESLLFTGNERAWPFTNSAKPVPRGHVPSKEGDDGGQMFMEALTRAVEDAGVDIQCDSRVVALLTDASGAVRGVTVKQDNEERFIEARKGVILASGGFVMNTQMTGHYMPEIDRWGVPYGNAYDLGDGIQMGLAAGACVINMEEAFLSFPMYPPANLTYGILVNHKGERYVNEDAYLARLGYYASKQKGQKVYLLVDARNYEFPYYLQRLETVATGATIEEVEQEAGFPQGLLAQSLRFYNHHAAAGEDPAFHKAKEWLTPIDTPPYALIDFSFDNQTAVIMPGTTGPLMFTLGGLETKPTGEVLRPAGDAIPGLFAAGRVSAGLPRTSKGYSSGMSVGDATFFGRLAGKAAASH